MFASTLPAQSVKSKETSADKNTHTHPNPTTFWCLWRHTMATGWGLCSCPVDTSCWLSWGSHVRSPLSVGISLQKQGTPPQKKTGFLLSGPFKQLAQRGPRLQDGPHAITTVMAFLFRHLLDPSCIPKCTTASASNSWDKSACLESPRPVEILQQHVIYIYI